MASNEPYGRSDHIIHNTAIVKQITVSKVGSSRRQSFGAGGYRIPPILLIPSTLFVLDLQAKMQAEFGQSPAQIRHHVIGPSARFVQVEEAHRVHRRRDMPAVRKPQ